MKPKSGYSDLDDRKYIGKVLAIAGVFAGVAGAGVAWPALTHIGMKFIS